MIIKKNNKIYRIEKENLESYLAFIKNGVLGNMTLKDFRAVELKVRPTEKPIDITDLTEDGLNNLIAYILYLNDEN